MLLAVGYFGQNLETQYKNGSNRMAGWARSFITILFLCVIVYFGRAQFSTDFWYDEVMSLEEFILVPIGKTVTDYPAPNNHIFFNLLMNLWCKLWGIESFAQAAGSVFVVRLLPILFALLTIGILQRVETEITKQRGIGLSVFLFAVVPFYNTIGQVRGYGLSMLLGSLLLYWAYTFYNKPTKTKGGLIVLFTALFLYTIPSNLYAILSALVVLGVIFIVQWFKYHLRIALRFNAAKLIGCFLLGIGLGVLLYLPVAKQVVNNEYVKSEGAFRWAIWGEAKQVFTYLFMPYYVLPVLMVLGLIVAVTKKADLRMMGILTALLVLPFVFSFIQGGKSFDRTFLWLCPILVLQAALFGNLLYAYWIKNTVLCNAIAGLILIALIFSFNEAKNDIDTQLTKGLKEGVKHQNIYYNYYLMHYHPQQKLGDFKREYYTDGALVYLHEVDKYAMHGYLPANGIQWEPYTDKIAGVNTYYIITAFSQKAINDFLQYDNAFTFETVSGGADFVNIIKATRKP